LGWCSATSYYGVWEELWGETIHRSASDAWLDFGTPPLVLLKQGSTNSDLWTKSLPLPLHAWFVQNIKRRFNIFKV
jgi:hypothetical protein